MQQLQKILKRKEVNFGFFVHPDPTITYLTSFETSFSLLIVEQNNVDFYISSLDSIEPISQINIKQFTKQWKKNLSSKKSLKIGINKETMTLYFFESLQKMYPNAIFVDLTKDLINLRKIKTEKELTLLKIASNVTKNAYLELINTFSLKKFKTEQSIANFLEEYMKKHDCSVAFPTIVATAKNSSIPHHITSQQKLKNGFLQLDFGARYNNYCSDMSRVLYIGKPNREEKEHFNYLNNCQKNTRNYVKKSMKFKELDSFSRKELGKYSSHFIHSLGHGVGVEVHENPKVGPSSKEIVQKNIVFTIEPGIYFYEKYGIRVEDTVYLNNSLKILTNTRHDLVKL